MAKKMDPMDEVDFEDESEYTVSRTPRWIAMGVLSVAVAGFMGLAYYAYHAGTRSIKDDELMLVEADSGPVKEKPADPGGMKFPNQDKTIFDAVSGSANKPVTVERVMPAPEQPVQMDQSANEATKAWVNEKLEAAAKGSPIKESPAAKPSAIDAKLAAASGALSPAAGEVEDTPAAVVQAEEKPVEKAAEKPVEKAAEKPVEKAAEKVVEKAEEAVKEPVKEVAKEPVADAKKPAAEDKAVELKKPAPAAEKPARKAEATKSAKQETTEPKPAKKTASGSGLAQLGAYRSEAEAKAAWKKIQGSVGGGSPDIQKADLGSKGVFYRLRVASNDAKALCQKLAAKSQPCIVVK